MTQEEFNNVNAQIRHLLGRCIMSENENNRRVFGIAIANKLNELEKTFNKSIESIDKSIDSLATAAETIQRQNDWIYCLYAALENEKEEVTHKANVILNAIKNYKK